MAKEILDEKGSKPPALYGLVLAGGKSLRMGHDKGTIQWHQQEQRYHIADILKKVCDSVFISCRKEQEHEISRGYNTLVDSLDGAGPLIGILSAFEYNPDVAWLVVACDLPLLDSATIQYLIDNRDVTTIATTFHSPFDQLPEPLITIWEPSAREVLLAHIADGYTCPRKALIRNNEKVKLLVSQNPDALLNANTPEDAAKVRAILAERVG